MSLCDLLFLLVLEWKLGAHLLDPAGSSGSCDPPSLFLSSARLPGTGAVCQLVTTALDQCGIWDAPELPKHLGELLGISHFLANSWSCFNCSISRTHFSPSFHVSRNTLPFWWDGSIVTVHSARARAQRTTSNGTAGEGIKSSSDLLWLTQRHPRSTPVFTVGDPYTPYRHIYSFNVSQWKLLKMGTSDWLHLASCKPPRSHAELCSNPATERIPRSFMESKKSAQCIYI